MTEINAVVIGCGRMGAFTSPLTAEFAPAFWLPLSHAEAIMQHERLALRGLCDGSSEALAKCAEKYPDVSRYDDFQAMLSATRPQLVTIATRTPERAAMIEDVLAAGVKALHVEKPLCNSMRQFRQLETAFNDPKIAFTFGTLRRYMPIYKKARDLARSGEYGEIREVIVSFGRGQLMWTHPHSLDLLAFFCAPAQPVSLSAHFAPDSYQCTGNEIDGDPIITACSVQFSDSVVGQISQAGNCDVVIGCDKGIISVEADGRALSIKTSVGRDPYWTAKQVDTTSMRERGGTFLALSRLVDALDGKDPGQVAEDKAAILTTQRLVFACCHSGSSGGRSVDPLNLPEDVSVNGRTGARFA